MPKKKNRDGPIQEQIQNIQIESLMGSAFGEYAKSIIQDRAIPDARDGLKPIQRRIAFDMYHNGNTYDKPFRKSAKTVGSVIAWLSPHGDASTYQAMVNMSQWWKSNLPLVEIQGKGIAY